MSGKEIMFTPVKLGAIELKNRLVMAPLTRMRAIDGDVPHPLAKTYYEQRASAGLIISEATQISAIGKGYPATPGIYSAAQTAAWKEIVSAVHARGGKMIAQLWHVDVFLTLLYIPSRVSLKLHLRLRLLAKLMVLIGSCTITKRLRR